MSRPADSFGRGGEIRSRRLRDLLWDPALPLPTSGWRVVANRPAASCGLRIRSPVKSRSFCSCPAPSADGDRPKFQSNPSDSGTHDSALRVALYARVSTSEVKSRMVPRWHETIGFPVSPTSGSATPFSRRQPDEAERCDGRNAEAKGQQSENQELKPGAAMRPSPDPVGTPE
jgi:hypothetical protein